METFVYDGSIQALEKLPELLRQGVKILCPKCGSELIVALDAEAAGRHKVHPGIYCSKNARHFHEMHEFRSRP
jgi:hypothetical protein